MENRIDFIIAIPEQYEAVERVINGVVETIEEPRYLKEFNDEIIFEKEVKIEGINDLRCFVIIILPGLNRRWIVFINGCLK